MINSETRIGRLGAEDGNQPGGVGGNPGSREVSQESRIFGEMGWELGDKGGRPAWYKGGCDMGSYAPAMCAREQLAALCRVRMTES